MNSKLYSINNKTNYKSIVLFDLIKFVKISFCCATWHVTIGQRDTLLILTLFLTAN